MKGSTVIIGIVLVVLIGFGAWALLWMNDESSEDVTSSETTEAVTPEEEPVQAETGEIDADHVVENDGSSFSPSEITINAGESVAFLTTGTRAVQVASNPHPQHTDLQGFDAGTGIGSGDVYVFTFEEVGQWGYHDHLNPSVTGTVIVQ